MMNTRLTFRSEATPADIETVREIIVSTGFFYDFEIPVALELVEDRVERGVQSDYHFLFAELDGKTVSYTCFGSIDGTEGQF